jgi:hypothetical protein
LEFPVVVSLGGFSWWRLWFCDGDGCFGVSLAGVICYGHCGVG